MKSSRDRWREYWEVRTKSYLAKTIEYHSHDAEKKRLLELYTMTKLLEDARRRHRQLQKNLDDVANLCDRLEVALEHRA